MRSVFQRNEHISMTNGMFLMLIGGEWSKYTCQVKDLNHIAGEWSKCTWQVNDLNHIAGEWSKCT